MSFLSSVGKALKSRTIWAGIGTTALGVSQVAAMYAPQILSFVPAGTPLGAGITVGLGVATVIARLRAKQPIGPVIDQTIQKSVDAITSIKDVSPATVQQLNAITAAVKNQPGAINKAAEQAPPAAGMKGGNL